MRHTILGAGGSIGNPLAFELLKSGQTVRLVSRSNFSIPGTETVKADISSFEEVATAVKGSDIVYLCAGLPYDIKVWAELWPKIIKNTLEACKKANAKLIFFDNVYMYGKVTGKMTEDTPYNPCSKKGEIRVQLAHLLEKEYKAKNLDVIIARAADLYGPYATKNSVPYIMVFDKLLNGHKPQWMVDASKLHTLSYTPDCARALVLLAGRIECFGQTWHLPSYFPPVNGKTFIEVVARETGMKADFFLLKKWMIKMAGLFNKTVAESYEMLYQNEFDYIFDSTKFNSYFNFEPTSYVEGVRGTIEFLKKGLQSNL